MNVTPAPSHTRRALLLGALLGCAAGPAAAWPFGGTTVEGQGEVTRRERRVARFNGIKLAVPGRLELRIGAREAVAIETEDNLQELIETVVEDGVLHIRPARRNLDLRTRNLRIAVDARQVERLALASSGSIESDPLHGRRLVFELGGSGRIDVRAIEADTVSVSIGGSGNLRCGEGRARRLSVSIGGSGDVDLKGVEAEEASVSIAGSGDVTLWAKRELNVSTAGSGDVNYYGDPRVRHSAAGSGDARRLAATPR